MGYEFLENITGTLITPSDKEPNSVDVRFYAYVPFSNVDTECHFTVPAENVLDRITRKPVDLSRLDRSVKGDSDFGYKHEAERFCLRVGQSEEKIAVTIGKDGDVKSDVSMTAEQLQEQYRAGMSAFRVMRETKEGLSFEEIDKMYQHGCILRFSNEGGFDYATKETLKDLQQGKYEGLTVNIQNRMRYMQEYGDTDINLSNLGLKNAGLSSEGMQP